MALVHIGLGSNLGNLESNLRQALINMETLGHIVACSSFYMSKAWGYTDQPDFCNAAASLETLLLPRQLLVALNDIEVSMGRVPTFRWGPRLIDLDILTYDDLKISEPDLTIPHPGLYRRATVLIPLAEIDASFVGARDQLAKAATDELVRHSLPPAIRHPDAG